MTLWEARLCSLTYVYCEEWIQGSIISRLEPGSHLMRLSSLLWSQAMVRSMRAFDNLTRRIAALATCLDPVAFERAYDLSFAKRRQAAWREAANRITR
jgi:hypothetical protein